ncbi:MAG: polyphosphate kinase [Pseudomonadota bacterium]
MAAADSPEADLLQGDMPDDAPAPKRAPKRRAKPPRLADVDLGKKLSEKTYNRKLSDLQDRLRLIAQAYQSQARRAVVVMEGWDAAGKGGAIRRIAYAMDPRGLKVWPIGAPRQYFKARHYLTRFWEKLPAEGEVAIFDRSWYGRVLVERVENFATEAEWRRAFDEINAFERMLLDDGARISKFFLHISEQEQLERFRARLDEPAKRWKLTAEDFRNRAKRPDYEVAIDDMLERTSTADAPWRVIAGENKRFARIQLLSALCADLEEGVDLTPPPLSSALLDEAAAAFDLSDKARAELERNSQ